MYENITHSVISGSVLFLSRKTVRVQNNSVVVKYRVVNSDGVYLDPTFKKNGSGSRSEWQEKTRSNSDSRKTSGI